MRASALNFRLRRLVSTESSLPGSGGSEEWTDEPSGAEAATASAATATAEASGAEAAETSGEEWTAETTQASEAFGILN